MNNTLNISIVNGKTRENYLENFHQVVGESIKSSLEKLVSLPVKLMFSEINNPTDINTLDQSDYVLVMPYSSNELTDSSFLKNLDIKKSIILILNESIFSQSREFFSGFKYYLFYDFEFSSHRIRNFNPDPQLGTSSLFWLKVLDIAEDIADIIKPGQRKSTVLISGPSHDIAEYQNAIARLLQNNDYKVLPENKLRVNPEDEIVFLNEIKQSIFNLFILGNTKSDNLPKIEWQLNKLIENQTEVAKSILWIPYGLKPSNREINLLIDQIRTNHRDKIEILQMPFDDFIKLLISRLEIEEVNPKIKETPSQKASSVYIIHDKKDEAEIVDLCRDIENKGFAAYKIDFSNTSSNLVESHRKYLIESDAIVIYDNQCPAHWLESKLSDVIKSPGYGRLNPFRLKAIFTSNPGIQEKNKKVDSTYQILPTTKKIWEIDFFKN